MLSSSGFPAVKPVVFVNDGENGIMAGGSNATVLPPVLSPMCWFHPLGPVSHWYTTSAPSTNQGQRLGPDGSALPLPSQEACPYEVVSDGAINRPDCNPY